MGTSLREQPSASVVAGGAEAGDYGGPADGRPTIAARRPGVIWINKVRHVYNIARVAAMLDEDENWPWNVATEMDQEEGLIRGQPG